ncbi:hypothetical protein GCM10009579_16360 [Streptomyces javensis]|uniref:Uncharacterized protein n=1 Tax=Streptomyces javensis TaxID=114698 RepID=A0ABP4HHD7_9ACTN
MPGAGRRGGRGGGRPARRLSLAAAYADRAAVPYEGRIAAEGPPSEVCDAAPLSQAAAQAAAQALSRNFSASSRKIPAFSA